MATVALQAHPPRTGLRHKSAPAPNVAAASKNHFCCPLGCSSPARSPLPERAKTITCWLSTSLSLRKMWGARFCPAWFKHCLRCLTRSATATRNPGCHHRLHEADAQGPVGRLNSASRGAGLRLSCCCFSSLHFSAEPKTVPCEATTNLAATLRPRLRLRRRCCASHRASVASCARPSSPTVCCV